LGVKKGSRADEVRRVFGSPWMKTRSRFHGQPETCWVYHAREAGTSIDVLGFCINKLRRVSRLGIGVHL
jgi:hypothetical protein